MSSCPRGRTSTLGRRRVYRALTAQPTVLYIDQTNPAFAPVGLLGGRAGRPARMVLRVDGRARRVPTKTTLTVPEGAGGVAETAGGGGWGQARERDPVALERDVRDGLVTRSGATTYRSGERRASAAAGRSRRRERSGERSG